MLINCQFALIQKQPAYETGQYYIYRDNNNNNNNNFISHFSMQHIPNSNNM